MEEYIPKDKTRAVHFFKKTYLRFLGRGPKLAIIKVVQNLKLEKNVLVQKWCPKLIFFNERKITKIPLIFDIEN
jgi:hypothetical protein